MRYIIVISEQDDYCEWINFRRVPVFTVFVEGPIHKFQHPRNINFLYDL